MQDPLTYMEENDFVCHSWQIKDGDFGAGCKMDLGDGYTCFIQLQETETGWVVNAEGKYNRWECSIEKTRQQECFAPGQ